MKQYEVKIYKCHVLTSYGFYFQEVAWRTEKLQELAGKILVFGQQFLTYKLNLISTKTNHDKETILGGDFTSNHFKWREDFFTQTKVTLFTGKNMQSQEK